MKQMIFLIGMMGYFTVRSLVEPFWAIFMYYGLAVLRPQAVWDWALNGSGGRNVRWSLIAAIAAAAAIFFNAGTLRRAVSKGFMLLVALFAFCLGGSYLIAMDSEVAAYYGWEYFKILFMLILSCYVVTERRHVKYLAWMILVCLTYLVYNVNSLYIFGHRLDIYHTGYGGLDNNGAALFLAMVVPFCYYFFQAERRWWRWGYLLCIVPTIHAVMLTYSRGAMLSLLVVGGAMLLWTARRHFVQTALTGGLFLVVVLGLAGPEVRSRFMSIQEDNPGSSQDLRFRSWRAGWNIAMDNPVFGVGLRNSNFLTKSYGADMEGRTIHNVYIQIAADAGFPAASLFIILIVLALWQLFWAAHRMKNQCGDRETRWYYNICLASFWSLAIYAFGSIFLSSETFEICYLLMLFGAVAPKLSRAGSEERTAPERSAVRDFGDRDRLTMGGQPA
jgi:probable O-glycosylation ligase (exosortase A-associated)